MAITFVSSSNTTYASRTNTTITAPASIADGDVILLGIVTGAGTEAPDPTPPAGFTSIGVSTDQTDSGGFNVEMRVYRKVAASEAGNYTFTHSSCSSQGLALVYRGVDNTTPLDTTPTANGGNGSVDSTATGLTTVTNNAWIVFIGHDWANTSNALSPPTGMTERVEVNPLIYVADEARATAGATGDRSHVDNTGGSTSNWAAFLVALRPAAVVSAGAGTGAVDWVGSATGTSLHSGSASGAVAWVGTATGTSVEDTDTTNLYPTGDGTDTDVVDETDATTDLYASIDDDPSAPNDADWNNNTDAAGQAFYELTDMPGDFDEAASATITVRYRGQAFDGSGTVTLYARLYQSDETSALSDEVQVAQVTGATSFANTSPIVLTGIVASDATTWDGARLRLRWERT